MNATPEELVRQALDHRNIPYEWFTIDPEFADTGVFCEKYGYPLEDTANTIVVASKKSPKQYCACLVLSHTRLDVNHKVSRLMGQSKASFATADEMKALTGMEVGGVTPFSLPSGMPLFVDSRVMERHSIIIGGGGRSMKIKIAPDALRVLGAQIVEGLAT